MNQDTICNLATANGIGAIGIIRVSGEQAIEICEKCFDGKALTTQQKSHTVHYGFIKDGDEVIDEVMVSIFWLPNLSLPKILWKFFSWFSTYWQKNFRSLD